MEPSQARELTTAEWQHVDEVLAAVLECPPAERAEFLRACAGEDSTTVDVVAALLDLDPQTPSFLDGQAVDLALPFLAGLDESQPAPSVGDRLGAYRLVSELGRGGMSVVYLAERDDARFQKQVAVKLIQSHRADARFRLRFQIEREILARLEHPAIARILDGGETEHGIPYLVMEYVDGEPVDAYCERHRLSVEDRLRLFLKIGEAVGHAHQNLVVHRDLKPGNVLVTAAGEVKLLDFGIAKVLADPVGAPTVTATAERALTPAYASPEQLRGEPVRTLSDVYSLGVLLYEMLAGRRPYREGLLPHEIAKAIVEEEPLRLSAAVGATRSALARRLRGDLDMIVAKALRKEPGRRYASVDAFLEDIHRHLGGQPVSARGAWTYRLAKVSWRHRRTVATAVLFVVAAIAFSVFYTRRVQAERDAARRAAATADTVQRFLVSLFEASDPYVADVRPDQITARTLLEQGATRLKRELASEPLLRAELLNTLGSIHGRLGVYDKAEPLLQEALALRRSRLGERNEAVAESLNALGVMALEKADYARGEALLRQAHALRSELLGAESAPAVETLAQLGMLLRRKGDLEAAAHAQLEVLRLRRRLLGDVHKDVAEALSNLMFVRIDQGDLAQAESLGRQALEMQRQLLGDRHVITAETQSALARLLGDKGDLAGAESLFRPALAVQRELLGDDHPRTLSTKGNLAVVLHRRGDLAGAQRLHEEVLRADRKRLGAAHPYLAVDLNNLASVARDMGRFDEAEPLFRESYAIRVRHYGASHTAVALAADNLGFLATVRGRPQEALRWHAEARRARTGRVPDDHVAFANTDMGMGRALLALGRPREAERYFRNALRLREKGLPAAHILIGVARVGVGAALGAQHRYAEAEGFLRPGYEAIAAAPERDPRAHDWALRELVAVYEATGRRDQAAAYAALLAAAPQLPSREARTVPRR